MDHVCYIKYTFNDALDHVSNIIKFKKQFRIKVNLLLLTIFLICVSPHPACFYKQLIPSISPPECSLIYVYMLCLFVSCT